MTPDTTDDLVERLEKNAELVEYNSRSSSGWTDTQPSLLREAAVALRRAREDRGLELREHSRTSDALGQERHATGVLRGRAEKAEAENVRLREALIAIKNLSYLSWADTENVGRRIEIECARALLANEASISPWPGGHPEGKADANSSGNRREE